MVRQGVNRPLLDSMAALYSTMFTSRIYLNDQEVHLENDDSPDDDQRVIATFENIYFSGWKYDPKVKFQRQSQVKSETIDDFDGFVQEIKEHSSESASIRMGSIDENNVIKERTI